MGHDGHNNAPTYPHGTPIVPTSWGIYGSFPGPLRQGTHFMTTIRDGKYYHYHYLAYLGTLGDYYKKNDSPNS